MKTYEVTVTVDYQFYRVYQIETSTYTRAILEVQKSLKEDKLSKDQVVRFRVR